jgi:hypothetical protein
MEWKKMRENIYLLHHWFSLQSLNTAVHLYPIIPEGFHLNYFLNTAELNLAACLRILPGFG